MKISKRNSILLLGILCIFYIPFNVSLSSIMYPGILIYAIPVIGCVLICLYEIDFKFSTTIKIQRNAGILCWMLIFGVMLIRNKDIANGMIVPMVYFGVICMMMLILHADVNWFETVWKVVRIYCCIHLFAGLFLLLNQGILESNIISLFDINDNAMNLLKESIDNGYMTGLTYHYSTMGMYMALGTISYSMVVFDAEAKKRKIDWIMFLLMFLGLFLAGKRGALLFTIFSLVIVYIFVNNMANKKVVGRAFLGIGLFLVVFLIAYWKVPQVQSVIERFTTSYSDFDEFSSGRLEFFWERAIDMFFQNPVIGSGWRAFKYKITMFDDLNQNDAHNIYIQLLAEVGIIGFCIVVAFFVIAWYKTFKSIKTIKKLKVLSKKQEVALIISLAYQTYFLLYGFSGNPLYDAQCYFPYFISCIMGFCAANYLKRTDMRSIMDEQESSFSY